MPVLTFRKQQHAAMIVLRRGARRRPSRDGCRGRGRRERGESVSAIVDVVRLSTPHHVAESVCPYLPPVVAPILESDSSGIVLLIVHDDADLFSRICFLSPLCTPCRPQFSSPLFLLSLRLLSLSLQKPLSQTSMNFLPTATPPFPSTLSPLTWSCHLLLDPFQSRTRLYPPTWAMISRTTASSLCASYPDYGVARAVSARSCALPEAV